MFRIDNSSASVIIPVPEAPGPKVDAFFTKGNPGGGIPATIVTDDWANATQEELCNFIENYGIALLKTDRTQLIEAFEAAMVQRTVCFSAYTTVDQIIPTGVNTKILFATTQTNEGSYFDTVTSLFTPPAGFYDFSNQLVVEKSGNGYNTLILLYKNGSPYKQFSWGVNSADADGRVDLPLSANGIQANGTDTFSIYCFQNSGSNRTSYLGSGSSFFSASKIGG